MSIFWPTILLVASIVIAVGGQILFKLSASSSAGETATSFASNFNLTLIFGFAAYFASAIFYVRALKTIPLSIAYPSLSVEYVAVVAISVLFLGELITAGRMIRTWLICAGVVLVRI